MSVFGNLASSAKQQAAKYRSNLNSQGLKNLQNTQLGDLAYSRMANLADRFGLGAYMPQRQLGSFGKIVFHASSNSVKTFDEFSRAVSNRTATHEIIGRKPILEYLGPGTDEITFTMNFNTLLGVDPIDEANAVMEMCKNGTAEYLIINGKPFGENKFVIVSVGENAKTWDNRGRVLSSSITVSLKESPDLPQIVTVTTTNTEGGAQ